MAEKKLQWSYKIHLWIISVVGYWLIDVILLELCDGVMLEGMKHYAATAQLMEFFLQLG